MRKSTKGNWHIKRKASSTQEDAPALLAQADAVMERTTEDLISVLISKGIIAESDLLQASRDRITARNKARSKP